MWKHFHILKKKKKKNLEQNKAISQYLFEIPDASRELLCKCQTVNISEDKLKSGVNLKCNMHQEHPYSAIAFIITDKNSVCDN